jgi:plastocyanin
MNRAAVAMGLLSWAAAAGAADHVVVIDAMAFTPKVLAVWPGDTVTWVNRDMFAHNVTATGAAAAAGVKSGDLQPGQRWRHTVRQGEVLDYLCTLHPVMTGRVEAKEVKEGIRPARPRSTS